MVAPLLSIDAYASMTVLIGRAVVIGSAWRCATFQVAPSRRKDHRHPQRDGSHVLATGQPRLGLFELDDVAKVRRAVSRHPFDMTYGAVLEVGGCLFDRLVNFRRSEARQAKRIRERHV